MKLHQLAPIATLLLAFAANANETHQYRLNGSLNDDLGGVSLTSNGGVLNAAGYSFAANQGLTLNADLGSVYTVDLSYHYDNHNGWQKIVDFSNLAADAGMYTLNDRYNFYPLGSDDGPAPANNVDGRLTLTRDASALVSIYSNGALVGSFTDSAGYANFTGHAANFFIDDHATGQREATSGLVNYLRTYDTALSAQQVMTLAAPVPEPETYAMLLIGLAAMALVARRRRS